jgi:hypothetical protein
MILAQLSKEIQYLYSEGIIIIIIRPLYKIAKTGIY